MYSASTQSRVNAPMFQPMDLFESEVLVVALETGLLPV